MFKLILVVLCLAGCTSEPPVDRKTGPDAALAAARIALHHHDLPAYYDALTDLGTRETLSNSIAICAFSSDPALRLQFEASGLTRSLVCEFILNSYGWKIAKATTAEERMRIRQQALAHLANPRKMAAASERNHRQTGAGSSFAWDWLDKVTLRHIVVNGHSATGVASFSDDDLPMAFERDATGWRFSPVFSEEP